MTIPIDAVGLDHIEAKLMWAFNLKTGCFSRLLADTVSVASVVPFLSDIPPLTKQEAAEGIFYHRRRGAWCGAGLCLRLCDPVLHAECLLQDNITKIDAKQPTPHGQPTKLADGQ
jgi:hypothetical protein